MKAGEKHKTQLKQPAGCFVYVPDLMTVVTCPSCGNGVDIWTAEEETHCFACDQSIFNKQRVNH
jgi:DNA-directed RNA polymerase subunit RPC12/RpoP